MGHSTTYYFASSPRHLMLFAGLALEAGPEQHNHLFFIEHIPAHGVRGYLASLEAWPQSPFETARVLEGDWRPGVADVDPGKRKRVKSRLKKSFRENNRRLLETVLKGAPPDELFVGIDNYYEVQYALHLATRMNPNVRRVYVEDGSSAYEYSYRNLHIRDMPKELLRTFRFGLWWRPCTLAGTSGWVDEAYVAFPELVLDRLKKLELHELPRDVYLGAPFREYAEVMGREFGLDVERLRQADLLVAVTNSKWGAWLPDYVATMRGICEALLGAGKRVALKLHPREQNPDPLGLGEREGLYHVPQQTMFEMLMVLVSNPEFLVVGDASTALIGARWLRPDLRMVALRHDPGGVAGHYLEKIFEGIGVTIESDPSCLPSKCFGIQTAPGIA